MSLICNGVSIQELDSGPGACYSRLEFANLDKLLNSLSVLSSVKLER